MILFQIKHLYVFYGTPNVKLSFRNVVSDWLLGCQTFWNTFEKYSNNHHLNVFFIDISNVAQLYNLTILQFNVVAIHFNFLTFFLEICDPQCQSGMVDICHATLQ